jgi:hypothetical protein
MSVAAPQLTTDSIKEFVLDPLSAVPEMSLEPSQPGAELV